MKWSVNSTLVVPLTLCMYVTLSFSELGWVYLFFCDPFLSPHTICLCCPERGLCDQWGMRCGPLCHRIIIDLLKVNRALSYKCRRDIKLHTHPEPAPHIQYVQIHNCTKGTHTSHLFLGEHIFRVVWVLIDSMCGGQGFSHTWLG